jgi:hypothetical protein
MTTTKAKNNVPDMLDKELRRIDVPDSKELQARIIAVSRNVKQQTGFAQKRSFKQRLVLHWGRMKNIRIVPAMPQVVSILAVIALLSVVVKLNYSTSPSVMTSVKPSELAQGQTIINEEMAVLVMDDLEWQELLNYDDALMFMEL